MSRHEIRENIGDFVKAGKAIFTIENEKTQNRFTFRVSKCEDKDDLFFVSVLAGPDNTHDYSYIGAIFGNTFKQTRGSKVSPEAQSFKVFSWFHRIVSDKNANLPESVHFYHEGKCGRCGRRLTVPSSVLSGFGPECIGKVFG